MNNLSGVIIMEGDTDIARLFCGNCNKSFRADIHQVTCANKQPICRECVEWANPIRVARGLKPMPFVPSAYLSDNEELPKY